MSSEKLVSVIMPVFNAKKFINDAIYSVLAFLEVGELILIDDGSTDGSYALCLEMQQKDNRCKILTHSDRANRGAAESRNLGIKAAVFPFISFLDADDSYLPNRFKESLDLLLSDDSLDACFGTVLTYDSIRKTEKHMGFLKRMPEESVLNYLLKGGYFHTNSITVRRDFFKKVGMFNQVCWPHEDSELWIRMAAIGKMMSLSTQEPIATYLIHGNNLSLIRSNESKIVFWKEILFNNKISNFSHYQNLLVLKQLFKEYLKRIISKI